MELAKRHLSHFGQMLELVNINQSKRKETESISKSTVARRSKRYI